MTTCITPIKIATLLSKCLSKRKNVGFWFVTSHIQFELIFKRYRLKHVLHQHFDNYSSNDTNQHACLSLCINNRSTYMSGSLASNHNLIDEICIPHERFSWCVLLHTAVSWKRSIFASCKSVLKAVAYFCSDLRFSQWIKSAKFR